MLKFLLKRSITTKCFVDTSFAQDSSVIGVAHLCLKVFSFSRNSLNFDLRQKDQSMFTLLKYGKNLVNQLTTNNSEASQLHLHFLFNLGVLYLEKGDFFNCKNMFGQYFNKYNKLNNMNHDKLWKSLYNIGISLFEIKRFEQSLFFFEKLYLHIKNQQLLSASRQLKMSHLEKVNNSTNSGLHSEVVDVIQLESKHFPQISKDLYSTVEQGSSVIPINSQQILYNTIKIMARLYFVISKFQECHSILHSYMSKVLEKQIIPEGFFRYLSMYFVCSSLVGSSDFQITFDKLLSFTSEQEFDLVQTYFDMFFMTRKVALDSKSDKKKLLHVFKSLYNFEKFMNLLNQIFSQIHLNANSKKPFTDLLRMLRNPNLSNIENSHIAERFLLDFLLVISHKAFYSKQNPNKLFDKISKLFILEDRGYLQDNILELYSNREWNSRYNSNQREDFNQQRNSLKSLSNHSDTEVFQFVLEGGNLDSHRYAEFNPAQIITSTILKDNKSKKPSTKKKRNPTYSSVFRATQEYQKKNPSPKKKMKISNDQSKHVVTTTKIITITRMVQMTNNNNTTVNKQIMKSYKIDPNSPNSSISKNKNEQKLIEMISKNNLSRSKCVCYKESKTDRKTLRVFEEFFTSLQKIINSEASAKVEEYFQSFLKAIEEGKLKANRFQYVKDLLNLHLSSIKETVMDEPMAEGGSIVNILFVILGVR